MKKLYRNKQKNIRLTEEELKIIENKFKLSKCKNIEHFIRKCLLEKEIVVIDLEPFYKIQHLLSNATNNINQIAKHTNTYGVIYKKDIDAMKQMITNISKEVLNIQSYLQNLGK